MRNRILSILLASSVSLVSLQAAPKVSDPSHAQWDDPVFVDEFLGSYGFLAGYEPPISEEEKEALRQLIDLIKLSPAVAIQQLEPQIKKSSSAAFDFILANLYFQEGNLDKASEYYSNAVRKHPDFRRAYKNLGLVFVQKGDYDNAIKAISKALELGEVDGRAYGLLGYGYLTKQKYYSAEAAYRQAILMQPEVKDWKVGLAQCLLETERYADAIALFNGLLIDETDNSDYWLLQANAFLGNEQTMMAAKNFEVVRRMGKADLSTLNLLGKIYINNQAANLALDAYESALELVEEPEIETIVKAAELLSMAGNLEQAKVLVQQIQSAKAEMLTQDMSFRLLTLKAKIARSEGDDATAVATLTQIVEQDSLNGEALIELAKYYVDEGDMAKATVRFEQAAKIKKFERDALVAHAQALVRGGDYSDALPLLRRALKIKSDNNLETYTQRVARAAEKQS